MVRAFGIPLLLAAAFFAFSRPAAAQTAPLTGEMTSFTYLIGGSWSCTTTVPATSASNAYTERAAVTFELAPGNTIHEHGVSDKYAFDRYFGYDAGQRTYFSTNADNRGNFGYLSSTDGVRYTGREHVGANQEYPRTVSYTKVSDNQISDQDETDLGGMTIRGNTVCTRQASGAPAASP